MLFVLVLIWNCNLLANIASIFVFLITSVMSKDNLVKCLSTCFVDQKLVENCLCTWKIRSQIYLKGDKFLDCLSRHSWAFTIWSFHMTNCCHSFFKNIYQRFPGVALFKEVTCKLHCRCLVLRKTKQRRKQTKFPSSKSPSPKSPGSFSLFLIFKPDR